MFVTAASFMPLDPLPRKLRVAAASPARLSCRFSADHVAQVRTMGLFYHFPKGHFSVAILSLRPLHPHSSHLPSPQ
jgi:hypothetical protein